MSTLMKLLLSVGFCASFYYAYQIYLRSLDNTTSKKTSKNTRKGNEKSKGKTNSTKKSSSHSNQTESSQISTDELSNIHLRAPFDNVHGQAPQSRRSETSLRPRKESSIQKKRETSEELTGCKSDSELREIESNPIVFKSCQYVKADKQPGSESHSTESVRSVNLSEKLTGSMTETEMKEIEDTSISFKPCEYIKADQTKSAGKEDHLIRKRNLENGE